jgi:hypothetical protein
MGGDQKIAARWGLDGVSEIRYCLDMAIKLRAENVVMARERAHAVFDLLFTLGFMTKDQAYHWLGSTMALERRETHIGRMHPEQCDKVVELVSAKLKSLVGSQRQVLEDEAVQAQSRWEFMKASCTHIGLDLGCGACAQLFFTGAHREQHDTSCSTKENLK